MQNQTTQQNQRLIEEQLNNARVFDENGVTAGGGDGGAAPAAEPEEIVEDINEQQPDVVAEEPPPAKPGKAAAAGGAKFRIGDREFATQEEALAYAEDTGRSANAQQQLLNQLQQVPPHQQPIVTPPQPAAQPEQVPEEFFTNPAGYLKKFGQQVYEQTIVEVQRRQASAQQSDNIWREFADRHPALADFRQDVESFSQANLPTLQGIIQTKGRAAGFDYIATKLKADWARKAEHLKPKRELANGSPARTPSQRAAGVTPEPTAKKPLTFAEQVNMIRKRGRRA